VDELSVVLPAFNEEANVEKTVRAVAAYLDQKPIDYEILVVDDGSAIAPARSSTRSQGDAAPAPAAPSAEPRLRLGPAHGSTPRRSASSST